MASRAGLTTTSGVGAVSMTCVISFGGSRYAVSESPAAANAASTKNREMERLMFFLPGTGHRAFLTIDCRLSTSSGHSRAPVVRLEERHVVLLRQGLEESRDRFRRAEAPAERFLVRLEECQEHLVAQLLVEHREKVRALVVNQARSEAELRDMVARHADPVGERDRRGVRRR